MAVKLTLDIFSGRPNPEVELEGAEAADLMRRLKPAGLLDDVEADFPESILGYRGVVVEQTDSLADDMPGAFRLAGGNLYGKGLAHRAGDDGVEDFLLGPDGPFSALDVGDESFMDTVVGIRGATVGLIRRPWVIDPRLILFPRPCPCGPLYEPAWWNVPARQPVNNCYNYSANYRTDTFAQPGQAAGAMYGSLSCAAVKPAAVADELIDSPSANNACPTEGHLVALVVAPGYDYHWYRKGRDGWWTHKPGRTAVTNLDNAGKKILDPRNADRGPYTDFCTFMVVMHGHIRIS